MVTVCHYCVSVVLQVAGEVEVGVVVEEGEEEKSREVRIKLMSEQILPKEC